MEEYKFVKIPSPEMYIKEQGRLGIGGGEYHVEEDTYTNSKGKKVKRLVICGPHNHFSYRTKEERARARMYSRELNHWKTCYNRVRNLYGKEVTQENLKEFHKDIGKMMRESDCPKDDANAREFRDQITAIKRGDYDWVV